MILTNIYGKYSTIRNASWQVLLDYNINSLPVSLTPICKSSGIKLLKDSDAKILNVGEYGVSIKQGNTWYIIYDDTDTRQRIRFTVAHELGHIFLGHDLLYGYHTRKSNLVKPETETAADMFAIRLLAPSCVLWGIGAKTSEDIAIACDISITAARIRAQRLDLLKQRNMFLKSPLEKQVFTRFQEYIINNRLR